MSSWVGRGRKTLSMADIYGETSECAIGMLINIQIDTGDKMVILNGCIHLPLLTKSPMILSGWMALGSLVYISCDETLNLVKDNGFGQGFVWNRTIEKMLDAFGFQWSLENIFFLFFQKNLNFAYIWGQDFKW